MLDFKLAVIGPTATRRFGVASGCAECFAQRPADAEPCTGFGPGCLGARAATGDRPAFDASSLKR